MVSLKGNALGAPLRENYNVGFTYADCWVEDSRLVVLNALDAKERGATISVGARLSRARRENGALAGDAGGRRRRSRRARSSTPRDHGFRR